MQIIGYKVDLSKPYIVLDQDETHVLVTGTSRVCQTEEGEYGGTEGTWRIPKQMLLTKQQKQQLRWIRKNLGDYQANKLTEEMYAHEISSHSNFLGA